MTTSSVSTKVLRFFIVASIVAITSACGGPSQKPEATTVDQTKTDSANKVSDTAFAQFDGHFELQARYPGLFEDTSFKRWLVTSVISNWHETSLSKLNKRNVIIQSRSTKSIYAFNITDQTTRGITIADRAIFKIETWPPNDTARFINITGIKESGSIGTIRPVVIFEKPAKLLWEVEFTGADSIHIYEIDLDGKRIIGERATANVLFAKPNTFSPSSDELANNELHHLQSFKAEADSWTRGATTVDQKCRLIFTNVNRTYTYDGNIPNISQFTWSDLLIRDANGRKGICDEWAVVEITYLRSLGIPAVMKFLVWKDPTGKAVAHAAVEYKDGGNWKQMDALWRAFNDPGIYRRTGGARGVTVMDAYDPLDARSTVPAWGVPDPTGDQKLNPYKDYLISPNYPGNQRPGYSY